MQILTCKRITLNQIIVKQRRVHFVDPRLPTQEQCILTRIIEEWTTQWLWLNHHHKIQAAPYTTYKNQSMRVNHPSHNPNQAM